MKKDFGRGEVVDARQALAISYYKDPESDTFSNIKRSLMRAGYNERYASSITGQKPRWLTENIQNNVDIIKNAEANLKKYIDLKLTIQDKKTNKSNIELAKLQTDVSKFVLKSLASGKYGKTDGAQMAAVNITVNEYKAPSASENVKEAEVLDIVPDTLSN